MNKSGKLVSRRMSARARTRGAGDPRNIVNMTSKIPQAILEPAVRSTSWFDSLFETQ